MKPAQAALSTMDGIVNRLTADVNANQNAIAESKDMKQINQTIAKINEIHGRATTLVQRTNTQVESRK